MKYIGNQRKGRCQYQFTFIGTMQVMHLGSLQWTMGTQGKLALGTGKT